MMILTFFPRPSAAASEEEDLDGKGHPSPDYIILRCLHMRAHTRHSSQTTAWKHVVWSVSFLILVVLFMIARTIYNDIMMDMIYK
jgi:hypothetical protein